MKKLAKILVAMLTAVLLLSLVACEGVVRNAPWLDKSAQDTPVVVDESGGRLLVYDDHGVQVYASSVVFAAASDEQYAQVDFYYKVVNSTDGIVSVWLENLSINGNASDDTSFLSVLANSSVAEKDQNSSLVLRKANNLKLTTTKREDGKYEFDRSIPYVVTGEFKIGFADSNVPGTGTFTLTIPANFPDKTFRTDEVWTSTK
ncbi:MAG: hypothetical protein FWG24_07195 [Eggerthellaceae bacterium]|jgi:hypothetical protein|nr:hypothetical protein [Eggerthellaceae bacterium]MDR2722025.1 hypothetical protein [Coriobacteriaceae bacterium]